MYYRELLDNYATIPLLLAFISKKHTQQTAVITPRSYNASLDPESNFTFLCDVTGADSIEWIVDNISSRNKYIIDREITTNNVQTVNISTGSFRSSITVPRDDRNRDTTIICVADSISSNDVLSDPVVFRVQGLLGAPSNLMLSEVINKHMRTLTWDEPLSLDITDIEQDISHYEVCYSISTEKSQCTCTDQTEFTFLYIRVPLEFTVLAVNVVGEGEATTIFHEAINCNNIGMYFV